MLSKSIGKGNDNLAAILGLIVGAPPPISAAGPSTTGAPAASRRPIRPKACLLLPDPGPGRRRPPTAAECPVLRRAAYGRNRGAVSRRPPETGDTCRAAA